MDSSPVRDTSRAAARLAGAIMAAALAIVFFFDLDDAELYGLKYGTLAKLWRHDGCAAVPDVLATLGTRRHHRGRVLQA